MFVSAMTHLCLRQLAMFTLVSLTLCNPATSHEGINFGDSTPNTSGSCVPHGGGTGECRELFSCPAVVKTFRRTRPVLCGFKGMAPVVCCPKTIDTRQPPPPSPPTPTTALTPIPPKINFECGRRNGRTRPPIRGDVVGGVESTPNSWPWMVALGRLERGGQIAWFCDGVLISPNYVLTAGHCVSYSTVDLVRLGEHNLRQPDVSPLDVRVTERIFHPGYRPPAVLHDLALLRLASPVPLTQKISPVCLPWVERDAPEIIGRSLTLTGWGATSYGGPMSDVLREVVVTVFPTKRCDAAYRNLRDYSRRFPSGIGSNFLCAGDRQGGKDACQGDSGGPLVYNVFGRYVLGGVVSSGHGCGQVRFPGIYSSVTSHLPWIRQVAFSETL